MTIHMIESMDAPDGGSGGGSTAPIAPVGTAPASAATSSAVAEPSVYEVDDTTLIRTKGSKDPVKFGDHVKGFQSQFTKASQEAARLKKDLEARDQRIQQFEQEKAANAQRQSQAQGQVDPFEALRALPYLSGEDAAKVLGDVTEQFRQRDQVLLATLKQLQKMQAIVGGLNENHSANSFNAKINGWLAKGGYPPEAANLAKEIYLAYEGDDLDAEFPRIFEERFNEVEKIILARQQQKLRANRPQPFVPGKGGVAGPSKPLDIKSNTSSREIADLLFPLLGENGT